MAPRPCPDQLPPWDPVQAGAVPCQAVETENSMHHHHQHQPYAGSVASTPVTKLMAGRAHRGPTPCQTSTLGTSQP